MAFRNRLPSSLRYALGCLVILQSCLAVRAQGTPESLVIGAGDLIHIRVFDEPELEEHARVSDSGNVRLVLGGSVHLANLSATEAADVIQNALKAQHYLLQPRVTVTIDEFANRRVTVLGEVKTPGAYAIPTTASLLDVLAQAGGLLESADRNIAIQHQASGQIDHFFFSNKSTDLLLHAPMVSPGDQVIVSRAGMIYLLGDVHAAGGYALTNNEGTITLLQLVARAGGAGFTAAANHTRIVHMINGVPQPEEVKLADMEKGKVQDRTLQPGEVIFVPFSYWKNFIINSSSIASAIGSAAVYRF